MRARDDSARFLKDECVKDYERGFAGPLLSRADMDRRYGEARWLPMPRFEVVQASGKRRPIDDGKRFGHNEASGFLETIERCSATQPATHLRALYVGPLKLQRQRRLHHENEYPERRQLHLGC